MPDYRLVAKRQYHRGCKLETHAVTVHNLRKILKPTRIAVIGASAKPGSVGRIVLGNLVGSGFDGVVYPVNPSHQWVQGIQAYPSVEKLPQTPDLAVVCTPAETVPVIVRQCGQAGVHGLVVLSAGFRETGEAGRALEETVRTAASQFPGMRIVGPNCLGLIVPRIGLNASFANGMPKPGHVAFVSQSGALCTSVLDWALQEGVGFSYFVSIGNMLDVSIGDLIDFVAADAETHSIILYVESVTDPKGFMSAARAFSRKKPIVAYKSGRFAESAEAAASHTGAMAGVDAVYEAAFQRAGIVRVLEVDDMFDCAELLARQLTPPGSRLAIVTNAGGPGVMATDALIARKGVLAALSQETLARLDALLPEFWSRGNPVDVLGDASPERFAQAAELVVADPGVDALLVILTPQAMSDPTETGRRIGEIEGRTRKPLLAAWMGGGNVQEGIRLLNQAGVPTYASPEKAIRAFMYLVSYARNREVLYETPRELPISLHVDREGAADFLRGEHIPKNGVLTEAESKRLLEAYGIPVSQPHIARSADEAVDVARREGFPVVAKVLAPQITHKTDVGGVVLNLADENAVRAAFDQIMGTVSRQRPEASIDGVTIQRMHVADGGLELIVGAKKDQVFGTVIMVGSGGIAAEIMQDRALELPPLNERLARRMLESLASWPLLTGYRGRRSCDCDQLIEVLMRVSYLVADHPGIRELDVNPLLVTPSEVTALDARVVVDLDVMARPVRPYAHLAIRPYPSEFTRRATLKDGTTVLLRPIKPEDEPLWHEMLANCSQESIWFRFRYLIKQTTHELAARFCFIDYDRELAIVAEIEEHGKRSLVGVGRLVSDPDHNNAEYAVLITDAWQGIGLGSLLTKYCLEISHVWGLKRVYGETTSNNRRMIETFRKHGFELSHRDEPTIVFATKELQTP